MYVVWVTRLSIKPRRDWVVDTKFLSPHAKIEMCCTCMQNDICGWCHQLKLHFMQRPAENYVRHNLLSANIVRQNSPVRTLRSELSGQTSLAKILQPSVAEEKECRPYCLIMLEQPLPPSLWIEEASNTDVGMASTLQKPAGGDVSRAPGFIACVVTTTTAALVTVCLRMYVRVRILHATGWDDWAILLAMVILCSPAKFWEPFLTCPASKFPRISLQRGWNLVRLR